MFNNIIVGQGLVIYNSNFDRQMNKVSAYNVKIICVNNSEKRYKRSKIRALQISNSCLSSDQVLALDYNTIGDLMKNQTGNSLGFQSLLIKNKNLPVETNESRQIFSESSLDFSLSVDDKNNKFRKLDVLSQTLYFEVRLKIPPKKNNSTEIGDTTCVQYEKTKNPDVSCESWYDSITNEVVCICNKQSLTVNVMDKTLSNAGKLSQFPTLGADLCKNKLFQNQ